MTIKIKVKTNSRGQDIEKISDCEYFVKLKSAPENNKANLELVKVLKKYFKKEIKIKSGFSSRNKVIELKD